MLFDTLRDIGTNIWSNYSDLTRPHPKWWFSKGNPLISGKSRLVKYYNLARNIIRFRGWLSREKTPNRRRSVELASPSIAVKRKCWPKFPTKHSYTSCQQTLNKGLISGGGGWHSWMVPLNYNPTLVNYLHLPTTASSSKIRWTCVTWQVVYPGGKYLDYLPKTF